MSLGCILVLGLVAGLDGEERGTVMVPTTLGPHSLTAATAAAVVQCSRTIFN